MFDLLKKLHLLGNVPYLSLSDLSGPCIIAGCGAFATGFYKANKYLDVLYFLDVLPGNKEENFIDGKPVYSFNDEELPLAGLIIFNCTNKDLSKFRLYAENCIINVNLWNPNSISLPIQKSKLDKFIGTVTKTEEFIPVNYATSTRKRISPSYFYFGDLRSFERLITKYVLHDECEQKVLIEVGMLQSLGSFNEIPLIPGSHYHTTGDASVQKVYSYLQDKHYTTTLLNIWNKYNHPAKDRENHFGKTQSPTSEALIRELIPNYHMFPPDFLKKWNSVTRNTIFDEFLHCSDSETGNLGVFVLRDVDKDHNKIISLTLNYMKAHLDFAKIVVLRDKVQQQCAQLNMRGGYWRDHGSSASGTPIALLIFSYESGFNIQETKIKVRDMISKQLGLKVNAIHSADDGLEALYYVKLLRGITETVIDGEYFCGSKLEENSKKLLKFGTMS